ncbi:unnamed protein product [Caenorhabditis sp. 36 PRJEB53466]|nr:unnamed protein product [Caenorhabditis sp. 36 PRJEB53466]
MNIWRKFINKYAEQHRRAKMLTIWLRLINVCILAIPAHSLFSTAALLYFIAPYRKFVKRLLRMEEESNTRMNMVSSVNL